MKIEKTANSQKITMSKAEWSHIGRQAGWMPKNVEPTNNGNAALVDSVRLESKSPDPQNQLHYSEIILYQDGAKWYVQPGWGVVGGNNPGGAPPTNFDSEAAARKYFDEMKNAQIGKGFEISNNENMLAKKIACKKSGWTKLAGEIQKIYWNKVPKDAEIHLDGNAYIYNGMLVFWNDSEAMDAQRFLNDRVSKTVQKTTEEQ